MALGVYSLVQLIVDLRIGRRITIEFDAPWMFVADALQLTAIGSLAWAWAHPWPRPWSWFAVAIAALLLRFAWEWRWGFACFPRRTRFGQWLDRRMAELDHRIDNWGRR